MWEVRLKGVSLTKKEKFLAVILAVSSFFLANILMKPRSITIIVRDNESMTIQTPIVYTLWEAILILLSSLLIGISSTLIVLSGSKTKMEKINITQLLSLLEGPEKEIMKFLAKRGGKVLQREIWAETGLSKVTVSRALKEMERKGLVRRKKYGATKVVHLSNHIMSSERR